MCEEEAGRMITEFNYLKKWILDYLDRPQSLLNNLPICPFAKNALINEKILFIQSIDYVNDIESLFSNWDETYDVAVVVIPYTVTATDLIQAMKDLNNKWLPSGYCCLEDHLDIPEDFHSIKFNNGKYNIVLCQKTCKLNEASAYLKEKGYYKNWTKEMYDDVVSWRWSS